MPSTIAASHSVPYLRPATSNATSHDNSVVAFRYYHYLRLRFTIFISTLQLPWKPALSAIPIFPCPRMTDLGAQPLLLHDHAFDHAFSHGATLGGSPAARPLCPTHLSLHRLIHREDNRVKLKISSLGVSSEPRSLFLSICQHQPSPKEQTLHVANLFFLNAPAKLIHTKFMKIAQGWISPLMVSTKG